MIRTTLCTLALSVFLATPGSNPAFADAPDGAAGADARVAVEAFWSRVWLARELDAIDELMAEDFVIHSADRTIGPRTAFKEWVGSFFANIEDLEFEVLDMFTDGTKVATRWRCSGKLKGIMFGVKGTGQAISFTGINLMTVKDGRITEAWVERDGLGIARSLGVLD